MTFEIAGDAIEGVKSAYYVFDPNGTERMKSFSKKYKDKFGVLPSVYSAYSYDSVMLYAAALKAGAKTGPKIKDYYYSLKDFEGVSGPITFDKDGVNMAPPVIREVKSGKFVDVKW